MSLALSPSSLWKLDLCTTVLPQIEKLLQSKYERYMWGSRACLTAGRGRQSSCRDHGRDPSAYVRWQCSLAVPSKFQGGQSDNKPALPLILPLPPLSLCLAFC